MGCDSKSSSRLLSCADRFHSQCFFRWYKLVGTGLARATRSLPMFGQFLRWAKPATAWWKRNRPSSDHCNRDPLVRGAAGIARRHRSRGKANSGYPPRSIRRAGTTCDSTHDHQTFRWHRLSRSLRAVACALLVPGRFCEQARHAAPVNDRREDHAYADDP